MVKVQNGDYGVKYEQRIGNIGKQRGKQDEKKENDACRNRIQEIINLKKREGKHIIIKIIVS